MQRNPFQKLPESVEINGELFPVNPDFRVGIAIEMECYAENPDVLGLLTLFYGEEIPPDIESAADRMMWFYVHHDGKETEDSQKEGGSKNGRWYDFEQDADALLASFLDAYGIDLSTAEMHWWVFRRLMLNLPADTPFMQRVRYRTADLNKLGKEEKKHYRKMRALYAIRQRTGPATTVEEREAALREKVQRRMEEAQRYAEQNGP